MQNDLNFIYMLKFRYLGNVQRNYFITNSFLLFIK
jgi:hypothetical protein